MSNSKLTVHQKMNRMEYLETLVMCHGAIVASLSGRVTLAFVPEFTGSRMLKVAVSYASPTEKKVRRKVGEYHALSKLFDTGEFIKIPDGFDPYDLVEVMDGGLIETFSN